MSSVVQTVYNTYRSIAGLILAVNQDHGMDHGMVNAEEGLLWTSPGFVDGQLSCLAS